MSESSLQPAPREAGEVERALAAVVLGAICLITLANVVVRYFTNYSFAATEEISVALMVVLALLGSATAVARRRHIAITILIDQIKASGVEVVTLTEAEKQPFQEATRDVYAKWKKTVGEDLVSKAEAAISERR